MRYRLSITCCLAGLLTIGASTVLAGQETPAGKGDQSDPHLKPNPMKTLQNFEPPVDEEYTLGAGDEISLDFPGKPELDGKKVVGPDGRITLPLTGSLDVANKTRSQVADTVNSALSRYYKDVAVTVSIDKYSSNRIIVIGNVQHPGVLYFDSAPTLLDAIARGGLMAGGGGESTPGPSARDGIPERCAIYRGNDQVVWVNLRSLLQSGNAMADLRLRRNDIVFVPAQQEVFVSVLGSVLHPGAITLTPESTLASVLAQAGGPADGAAKNIQVIQPSTGKTMVIPFKSLLTVNGADEVKLHAGDVIYIPQSGFYKATYVVQRISPIVSMGTVAAALVVP